jgi:hypothetical protein
MSYYAGQSNILLTLDTGTSMASATNTKILYTKPNGLKGSWTATASGNTLQYQLANGDIDQHGTWKFQAYAEIATKKAYGQVTEIHFDKPLN